MESAAVTTILLLVSSWLNLVLYTAELFLCCRYFLRAGRPFLHKLGVAALAGFDTISTMGIMANACLANIPPPTTKLVLLFLPLSSTIFATYCSAAIAQLFLCNLFFQLTGNIFVVAFLVLSILVHCAFSFASAVMILTKETTLGIVLTTTTVGAVGCAATDICIAACLSYKLWKMLNYTGRATTARSLVQRILILTISSGALVASNTLIMMVLVLRRSAAFDFFFASQGRLYSLTILGNFLLGIPAAIARAGSVTVPRGVGDTLGGVVFHVETYQSASAPGSNSPKMTPDRSRFPTTLEFEYNTPQQLRHIEEHQLDSLKSTPV
ncbi:hypothetical protein DFH09DRAFT_229771 [Mycena vulgaris]|nr:hypothetical protein DFH09DRAFT_229771 [Mycena vulgaris]